MLDRQSGPATLGEPLAVATSLLDPFCPGGRGAVSSRRSLFKYLNRPQANTSALPLLTPVYSPEGQVPQRTMHKLLYEPTFVMVSKTGFVFEFANTISFDSVGEFREVARNKLAK